MLRNVSDVPNTNMQMHIRGSYVSCIQSPMKRGPQTFLVLEIDIYEGMSQQEADIFQGVGVNRGKV